MQAFVKIYKDDFSFYLQSLEIRFNYVHQKYLEYTMLYKKYEKQEYSKTIFKRFFEIFISHENLEFERYLYYKNKSEELYEEQNNIKYIMDMLSNINKSIYIPVEIYKYLLKGDINET